MDYACSKQPESAGRQTLDIFEAQLDDHTTAGLTFIHRHSRHQSLRDRRCLCLWAAWYRKQAQASIWATTSWRDYLQGSLEFVCTDADVYNNVVHARVRLSAQQEEGLQNGQGSVGILLLRIPLNDSSVGLNRRWLACTNNLRTFGRQGTASDFQTLSDHQQQHTP